MKWFLTALACLAGAPALAIQPQDAAYFCTPEASGGVRFDESTKQWTGARFRPDKGFVLKLRYVKSVEDKIFEGATSQTVHEFQVNVTPSGANAPSQCLNSTKYDNPIRVWPKGSLHCEAGIMTEYTFNPDNNRFMTVYPYGYTNGKDTNEDTPYIAVGVCTEIN